MKYVSQIRLSGLKQEKQRARESMAVSYGLESLLEANSSLISRLSMYPLAVLDRKIKHGESLSFEEAFCGMCLIIAATNVLFYEATREILSRAAGSDFTPDKALANGIAFAQLMAAKEAFSELTSQEVAGLVAATMMDIVSCTRLDTKSVVETSGMGGDVGFLNGGTFKTINVSTLSALVLAAAGLPAIKHGSYSNTSVIGSTEAIELFGAKTAPVSEDEVRSIFSRSGFCFMDAHWAKTIHDLSHLLMVETINHVVGPMSVPIGADIEIHKLMGVNEKVHPSIIARAYALLHERRVLNVGGVAIVTGLDCNVEVDPENHAQVRAHSRIDELSPYASVVAFSYRSHFLGSFLLQPSDFGLEIDADGVKIENNRNAIQAANQKALRGTDPALSDYLAMNAALGMFANSYLYRKDAVTAAGINTIYLRECFQKCREVIDSGRSWDVLCRYVQATGGQIITYDK